MIRPSVSAEIRA